MSREEIESLIPHRASMLLLDEIVEFGEKSVICRKTFRGDEYFYDGHYPGDPITPGVILCESAVQAGALLASRIMAEDTGTPVLVRIADCRFKHTVRPGQTIELHAQFEETSAGFHFFSGKVICEGRLAVRLKYVSAMVEPSDESNSG